MKKLLFICFLIVAGSVSAKDVLTLRNSMRFEGTVVSVRDSIAEFSAAGTVYEIPLVDISEIILEDTSSRAYSDLINLGLEDVNPCQLGHMDAELYHGKKCGHFVLGVLFGPFALIGTALSNPTPERGSDTYAMSKNQNYFSDPCYLSCYKKKARSTLLVAEALGWATWILLMICFSAPS